MPIQLIKCLARLFLVGWLLAGGAEVQAQTNSQQIYLQCLTNFETYAETIWHTSGAMPDSGYWGDGGSTGNGGIRGNGGVALAYAVLCLALPNDARFTNRLARVRQALNYDCNTHVTGGYNTTSGNKWGWSGVSTDWQTPEWSGSLGLACILLQSNLPAATIAGVRTVVVSEANHRAGIAPASGHVSDTKAEENAWQGNILALAAAWMSTSNSATTWSNAAISYLVNTYTVGSSAGDPLAGRITTYNLYNDWALENHGFYHPTYEMVAGMSSGDSWLMAKVANPNIAAQFQVFAEHNVLTVWTNNMRGMVMDSGDFAYPDGIDWELHDYEQYSFIAWLAAHYNDPVARWDDFRLAQLTRYRQLVNNKDATSPANYGTFVGASGGGFYREAVAARRVAICWLHWNFADYPAGPVSAPAPALANLPDVAVLTCRGTNGFVSLSYGPQTNGASARIMAAIEPPAAGFPSNTIVTTPRLPGIIGLGALGSPTGGRLVALTTNGSGFSAELQLTNGINGTTEVYFYDTGDSVGLIEVPAPVSGFAAGAAASFSTGIENDPLCGGARLLEWSGASALITNRSGATLNVTNNWACVSGNYGVLFGPAGYWNYTATTTYNRLGAAEDTLAFLPTNSLTPRYAVYFPGRNALQTSNLAAQIAWNISGTNATLNFPANGGLAQISALVPLQATNPAYPPYQLGIAGVTASSTQSATYPATNAVDNNAATFWVSLYGPTNHAEWLFVNFPRPVALAEFRETPRNANNGYGPSTFQLFCNVTNLPPASGIPTSGSNFWSGTGFALTTLDVKLPVPVWATNVLMVITGAYDSGPSSTPRNVQLSELAFYERAQPGTFANWQLQRFTDAQLANSAIGPASADPDGDGVPNLLEYAVGGNPFVPDATNAMLQAAASGARFYFQFQERSALGNVARQFQSSADLLTWTNLASLPLTTIRTNGDILTYQATVPAQSFPQFFRVQYRLTN
ncbi:MAG: discoidin domain-containing protein [Verrucomicrobiota bacterium]